MGRDNEKLYSMYDTFLSISLTSALVIALNHYYNLRVHGLISVGMSILLGVLLHLFNQNRKNGLSYLIPLCFIPVIALILWLRNISPISWFYSFLDWCYIYNGAEELYVSAYGNFLVFSIAFIGSVVLYILMKKLISKIALAAVIIVMLVILAIYEEAIHKLVVGICFFFILTVILEVTGRRYSRRTRRPEKKNTILYLTPICLLIAILSVGMPSNLKPIQWEGVRNLYHNIMEKMDTMLTKWNFVISKDQGEFTIALTGYEENGGKLGFGTLLQSDKVALTLTSIDRNSPVYLIGSVSDRYTGNSWEKSGDKYIQGEQEYILDYIELVYALSRLDSDIIDENMLVDRNIFYITYKDIKTRTLFYPLKSSSYEYSDGDNYPVAQGANILFPKSEGAGTKYKVSFYEINHHGKAFQKMLKDADQFSYEKGNTLDPGRVREVVLNHMNRGNADLVMSTEIYYGILRERAKLIQEGYTELPDSVPERVRRLALDITEDQETTYDKLRAIEAYLWELSYDLDPGNLPEGEDFVDYFLFESHKGYCTSFASAMAIMARAVGIPTRYVEGYVVDYSEKKDISYLIRDKEAHAWAEAYIEGVGWIPFEATPSYNEGHYTPWKEPEGRYNREDITFKYYNKDEKIEPDTTFKPEQKEELSKDKIRGFLSGIIILVVALLNLAIMVSIYYWVISYRYRKAFQRADYSQRMYLIFLRIMAMLQKEGYQLGSQETIKELAERIGSRYQYNEITFSAVSEIYMGYRYGQEQVTKEELEGVEIFHEGLRRKRTEDNGPVKMLLEEFLYLAMRGGAST